MNEYNNEKKIIFVIIALCYFLFVSVYVWYGQHIIVRKTMLTWYPHKKHLRCYLISTKNLPQPYQ